jgi:hypothetical protein
MLMMLARFFISGPAIAKLKTVDNARLLKQFDRAIYGCDGNCVIFFNGAAIELIDVWMIFRTLDNPNYYLPLTCHTDAVIQAFFQ